MNLEQLYSLYLRASTVSTDSRNIPLKSIFFALKGQNFNGNEFAKYAIESGASFAIVDEKEYEDEIHDIFYVENGLNALQKLAQYHRQRLSIPIIALTGSNGKTTSKELISQVLSKKYNVAYTKGNLNNHIGVPLTLLSIHPNHEIAVVEMGANHQLEIDFLCTIAEPDFGYITNFGKAHLEGFGGTEGVIKGKSELYRYLRKNKKTAFINCDDSKQMELSEGFRRITFGSSQEANYPFSYEDSLNGLCPEIHFKSTSIQSCLIGEYNLANVAAAVAVGLQFDVKLTDIKEAIESYKSDNNRSQIIKLKEKTIILDAYNANPSSMEAALINFSHLSGEKAVILGDMFELGESSFQEHQKIAELAMELAFGNIFLIGQHFNQIHFTNSVNFQKFETRDEFENFLQSNTINQPTILVKGSRGMTLEKILDQIS